MSLDQASNDEFEVCLTQNGDYYIRNEAAILDIVRNVREGHYCTILGPPYCQKSLLLNDVKARLETTGDEVCVLLGLQEIDFVADEDFLHEFAAELGVQMQEQTGIAPPTCLDKVAGERSLQRCLQGYVASLQRDIVLLIDHLERVRRGPLKSLLRVLRAIYTERDADAPYRLEVVTANSLSAAALALGPTSPFNIAHVILVRDLTTTESEKLIHCVLEKSGIEIASAGCRRLIQATGGNRYLIPRLCRYCTQQTAQKRGNRITEQKVEQAITWFVEKEAARHPPLRETIRAIEASPVNLMNFLKVLEQARVERRDLELDLGEEIDDLQLTGAVRVETIEERRSYLIRNEIYEHYLKQHFHPERVVRVLSMAGRWDEAISYLERLVIGDAQYRSALLSSVVNSTYAAGSEHDACVHLGRSLSRAFSIGKIRIYLMTPERSHLKLVSQWGFEEDLDRDIPLQEESPEVDAFFGRDYEAVQSPGGEGILFVPLLWDWGGPLGLATIHGFKADPQHDDFLELLTFLKQISRAIGYVIDRERKLFQLTALYQAGKQVTSSLDIKQVQQTTVKLAIEAVPAAQKGSLFLWDETRAKLIIQAHVGFRPDIVEVMQLSAGEGYAGWAYTNRKPVRLGNVLADPRTVRINHPDVEEEKSGIAVPLEAWGRVIGVLCLDNTTAYDAFQESDLDLLSTFGTQAAIAIQNAHLYTELYQLGIDINRGELNPEQIFKKAVQSITRVSDAKAANMLLLSDTDDPELSLSQKPLLSVFEGLGADFEKIRPRPDGLTHRVLKTRKPAAVSSPGEPPGINPLPLSWGIQAYLGLPMMIQDAIIGVLFVHYDEPHVFSDNEIQMLSLFANQAALAIQNAQQQEELTMTKAVAWMGIVFSSLAHRITQKAGAIRNTAWGLRNLLEENSKATEMLDHIDEYAQAVGDIPSRALLPYQDQAKSLDLGAMFEQEIPGWCAKAEGVTWDLSGLATDAIVYADPHWLGIVLEILATNATRAMKTSPRKKLTVCSEIRGQRVVVEMTNTGEEIPESVQRLLFKMPVPKDQGVEGSGVGLLIARTIMRHYGGDIELVRTSQEETTFSFWLPLDRARRQ